MKHTPMPWVDGYIKGITGPTTPSICGPTVLERIEFDGWLNDEDRRNISCPQRRHRVIAHGLTTIAIVTDADEGPDTMMGNFYLMKASPKLLESLVEMLSLVRLTYGNLHDDVNNLMAKADEAISEALGNPTPQDGQQ